jgi:hypothetical protein
MAEVAAAGEKKKGLSKKAVIGLSVTGCLALLIFICAMGFGVTILMMNAYFMEESSHHLWQLERRIGEVSRGAKSHEVPFMEYVYAAIPITEHGGYAIRSEGFGVVTTDKGNFLYQCGGGATKAQGLEAVKECADSGAEELKKMIPWGGGHVVVKKLNAEVW